MNKRQAEAKGTVSFTINGGREMKWTKVTITKINIAKNGKGGSLQDNNRKVYNCGCFNGFPQNGKVGDKLIAFISFGKVIETSPIIIT
ncbi:MAG TPA: hypothetical protein ENH82_14570 [bacterium]|nr:hypothetical protein [bacterium]